MGHAIVRLVVAFFPTKENNLVSDGRRRRHTLTTVEETLSAFRYIQRSLE